MLVAQFPMLLGWHKGLPSLSLPGPSCYPRSAPFPLQGAPTPRGGRKGQKCQWLKSLEIKLTTREDSAHSLNLPCPAGHLGSRRGAGWRGPALAGVTSRSFPLRTPRSDPLPLLPKLLLPLSSSSHGWVIPGKTLPRGGDFNRGPTSKCRPLQQSSQPPHPQDLQAAFERAASARREDCQREHPRGPEGSEVEIL